MVVVVVLMIQTLSRAFLVALIIVSQKHPFVKQKVMKNENNFKAAPLYHKNDFCTEKKLHYAATFEMHALLIMKESFLRSVFNRRSTILPS